MIVPDIEVEWQPSALCSICEMGGNVKLDEDGEGVRCSVCGTWWRMDGSSGERDEVGV